MITETINWTHVSGRLPKDEHEVLVFSNRVQSGWHAEDGWVSKDSGQTIAGVTHWAEMPRGPI